MEISSNQSLLNNNSLASSSKTEKTETQSNTQSADTDETTETGESSYDFIFKNADGKFLDSFSKLTSNMPIMDAAFMKTKVEVDLINYNREQIRTALKEEMGDDFEITEDMETRILEEAKRRASEDGFENTNMQDFLGYMNQNIQQNPLLQSSNTGSFFSNLQTSYNMTSLNSLG